MKNVLIAWLLMVVLLAGMASCGAPRQDPMDPDDAIGLMVEAGPSVDWMDSTGTADSLLVAKARIKQAYFRQNGRRVQQVWKRSDGDWISIELRQPDGDGGLTFYIREPSSGIHDPITCHEGWEQDGSVTPIGTCEYYSSHWDWAIDLVLEKLTNGEMHRWDVYEHETGWTQFYMEWGERDPETGSTWRAFLAMPQPQKPYVYVKPVPYLNRRIVPKRVKEVTTETGRGEQ